MNKTIAIATALAVTAGAGGFFGGIKYAQNKTPAGRGSFAAGLQNLSSEERQQRLAEFQAGGGMGGRERGGMGGGGFTAGEILSRDDKSITVKLPDGGSKIIFFSESTSIGKSTAGTADDLTVGKQVTATGAANSDGTISAQNIQIR